VAAASASYLGVTAAAQGPTGLSWWDGVLGVVLGLFVCSLPVRHFLDLLLYWRIEGSRFPSRGARAWWIALNALVLGAGWLVIVVGATRFMTAGR
jgi:hypothetical protein